MNVISLPVRPPIFPRAFPTPFAAPLMAGPAADETLDRPSEALDWILEAVCEALEVASFAASVAFVVVDSNRRAARPGSFADCRRRARDIDNDIVISMHARRPKQDCSRFSKKVAGEQLISGMKSRGNVTIFADHREVSQEPR
jgi:hypothetical protein